MAMAFVNRMKMLDFRGYCLVQFIQDCLLELVSFSASIFKDVAVTAASKFCTCHDTSSLSKNVLFLSGYR